MAVLMIMAQQSNTYNANNTNSIDASQLQQQVKPMFHDFLGMKATDSPVVVASKTSDARLAEASPSASASLGASSGGGRGPISSSSDLGSERQMGNHLEGVPCYGPRSDISGTEISNRVLGSKRSNSDSAFMAHDSLESLHLMKMLCNGAGAERSRRSIDDEGFLTMSHLRPSSASLILQPPAGSRIEANVSKWERNIPMNVGPAIQYPPRGSQFVPFVHQVPSNRFKEANASPSVISQTAADEGSRTGIKGPGILNSSHVTAGGSEKNSSGILPSGSRLKSGTHISEPESSTPSRQGVTSGSRQMTIFYGGQAHVFDDVHPNKADVIMALAGSNGGSWSTTYSPKSVSKAVNESHAPSGESEGGGAVNVTFPREFRGRLSMASNTANQGTGSADRILTPTGGHQGSLLIAKDMRNPVQAAEPSTDEKRDL